ncbi:hypothetical protein ACWEGQ_00280 [Streptomyces seoulensis]
MPRYRKRPVEIEAVQWDGTDDGATRIIDWILSSGATASYTCSNPDRCSESDGDTVPHPIAETDFSRWEETLYAASKAQRAQAEPERVDRMPRATMGPGVRLAPATPWPRNAEDGA